MTNPNDTANDALYGYYLSLLRSELNGTKPPEPPAGLSFRQLYAYSLSNSTAHMLRRPLGKLKSQPNTELYGLFTQQYAKCAARDAIQKDAFNEIVRTLCGAGVELLPLKGIELKSLYPDSVMRRMSDIDIVYDSHGNDELVKSQMESLGYTCEAWGGGHHDIFHKLPILNLELHRRSDYPEYYDVPGGHLPDSNVSGLVHLSPADMYILLLKHDAKHMRAGGLGVRAVCDIFVMQQKYGELLRPAKINTQLEKYGLVTFESRLRAIAGKWFSGEATVSLDETDRMLLGGHTYGSTRDSEILKITSGKKRSKLSYASNRIFPPYSNMCNTFGILKKLPFLLPLFWVVRWIRTLIDRKRRRNIKSFSDALKSTSADRMPYDKMFSEFGLDKVKATPHSYDGAIAPSGFSSDNTKRRRQ